MLVLSGIGSLLLASVLATVPSNADGAASPIFGVKLPRGYRQWPLISVSHLASFRELRGIVGNDAALRAFRNEETRSFPAGTILVKLAWNSVPLPGVEGALVSGPPTKVQVMVKDAKKYAATGGWGFGSFVEGKPTDAAEHQACFACHEARASKRNDYVFTHFAR